MLKRIVILNSSIYSKAEVKLDDCDSIQLVGPNNIGKSTLIYALNFLFIVDGSRMSFSGNRRGDKETIHHYFPTIHQSYIIFEISKASSYCIVVKRDVEGELEYYKLNSDFREEFFFEKSGTQLKIRKFDEVKENMEKEGIELSQFRNKTEYFNFLYQRGRGSDAAVWLEDNVKTDGLNNNFSKVYRYLINSKLITNKSLKDALIIADNRENEALNFSHKNKKDISDLLRINDEIKAIRNVQEDFESFRHSVSDFNARTKIISELLYAYNAGYATAIPELSQMIIQKEKEIAQLNTEVYEVLEPLKQTLNQEIGAKTANIETQTRYLADQQRQVDEIKGFESKEFLTETLANLNHSRRDIEARVTRIESQKLSTKQIDDKLDKLNAQVERLEGQVKNYDDQLIHQVAEKQKDKKLLYTIFSEEFASQNAELVKKKISKTGDSMKIFDGEVKIPKDLKLKELPSTGELKDELTALKQEQTDYKKLAEVAADAEKTQQSLTNLHKEILEVQDKIRLIDSLPKMEKKIAEQITELNEMHAQKEDLEKKLSKLNRELFEKSNQLQRLKENKAALDGRIEELRNRKIELESIGLDPAECETTDSLDVIYNKVKMHHADRDQLKVNKDKLFDNIRYRLKSNLADEEQFVKYIEEEIACLNDREKSIEGLLQSISTQFANPAFNLIRRYQEFREFVYHKFNHKVASTKISDIESLQIELVDNKRVLDDLVKISSIQDLRSQTSFDFESGDNREKLEVLNKYLDNGKKIDFGELFDIELHLTIKGHLKKVDLKDQVESDGTDRMIRLVIVMSIINRLAVHDEENKIALFIDEVGTIDEQNRPELVKFCKDHHFIPIFAAPQPYYGFSKYYFIFRTKGKIQVSENQNAISSEFVGAV